MSASADAPWVVWIVDAVLAIAMLEAMALIAFNLVTGRGLDWRDLIFNLGAGLCLMAGIRCVVAGAPLPWLMLCLAGAGSAHVVDLVRRARQTSRHRRSG